MLSRPRHSPHKFSFKTCSNPKLMVIWAHLWKNCKESFLKWFWKVWVSSFTKKKMPPIRAGESCFSKMASKMAARYGKILEKGIGLYQSKLMIKVSMNQWYICSWLLSICTWCFILLVCFKFKMAANMAAKTLKIYIKAIYPFISAPN